MYISDYSSYIYIYIYTGLGHSIVRFSKTYHWIEELFKCAYLDRSFRECAQHQRITPSSFPVSFILLGRLYIPTLNGKAMHIMVIETSHEFDILYHIYASNDLKWTIIFKNIIQFTPIFIILPCFFKPWYKSKNQTI